MLLLGNSGQGSGSDCMMQAHKRGQEDLAKRLSHQLIGSPGTFKEAVH